MKRSLIALVLMLLLQCSSNGAFSLSWSPSSGSAGVGSPIVVSLFLNDTTNEMNTSGIGNADIVVTSSLGTLDLPVANTADFPFSSTGNPTSNSGEISESALLGAGIGGGNSLLLGTFTINSAVTGSGTLTVQGISGNPSDITSLGASGEIGSAGFFTSAPAFNFTFTAVPEPTSLIAASGMGLVGAWVVRRRKAKAKLIENA